MRINAERLMQLRHHIEGTGSQSVSALAKLFGVHVRTMRAWVTELRKTPGVIYISGWDRHSAGVPTPRYSAGKGPDEPRPNAISDREHQQRRRSDPAVRDKEASRKQADRLLAKTKSMSVTSALLFGGIHGNATIPEKRKPQAADSVSGIVGFLLLRK